jgi:uncharacterized protein (DUF697 family)
VKNGKEKKSSKNIPSSESIKMKEELVDDNPLKNGKIEKETDNQKQTVETPPLTNNKQKEIRSEMNTTKQKTAQTQSPNEKDENEVVVVPATRTSQARHIVKNRMIASVGAGLIPFPAVDIAALTGIQLDTVRALSKLYEVKFTKDLGKTAISSLTGGLFPVATGPWVSSIAKSVPVVGQLMGAISMPVVAGASTYALGQVFIQHFESGGTFLTFDPEKVKDYFQQEFEKGKDFAKKEAEVKAG